MKTWFLPPPYTDDDIDWINHSGLSCEIQSPYDAGDSGWCDMDTGQQILTSKHKIYIHTIDDKEETWLSLKYDSRVQLRYQSLTDEELEEVKF